LLRAASRHAGGWARVTCAAAKRERARAALNCIVKDCREGLSCNCWKTRKMTEIG